MGLDSLSQVTQALLDRMPSSALKTLRILMGVTLTLLTVPSLRYAPMFGWVLAGGLILVWALTATDGGLAVLPTPLFALSFVALLAIGFPLGVWESADKSFASAYTIMIILFALCSTGFCWIIKQEDARARRRKWYEVTYLPWVSGQPLPEIAFRPLRPHPIGAVRQVMLKQWTAAVILSSVSLSPALLFIFGLALWMRQRWTAILAGALGAIIEISRLIEDARNEGIVNPGRAIAIVALMLSIAAWIEAARLPLWPRHVYKHAHKTGVASEPAIACKDGMYVYEEPTLQPHFAYGT